VAPYKRLRLLKVTIGATINLYSAEITEFAIALGGR
jgi:hypothetical protein